MDRRHCAGLHRHRRLDDAPRPFSVRWAAGTADELAHGLKTPLAVLLVEVQRAEDAVNMNWPPRCGCSSTGCAARSTTTSPTPAPPPPVPPSAPAAPSSNRPARSLER